MKNLVLIIEDNQTLQAGMAKLVQMQGHEAITAGTISQGLEQLKSRPTHLLLDMHLPDGRGTTVLGHIRQQNLPIKVAVISGSIDSTLLAEAKAMQPDAVFTKPPDWGRVIQWLEESTPLN